MPKLIFDIETVGVDFDSLDNLSQESLLRYSQSPEQEDDIKEHLGFSPLTGRIVAIGILNPDTDKGAVYFQSGDSKDEKTFEDNVQYVPATEKEILQYFWEVVSHYDQFITFNGRTFDCPYIMVRSAILKVKPSKNLMPNRYWDEHVDLLDRLTFFGATKHRGKNLHMWCQAFGIKSPKANGITGDDVARLFKENKQLDVARYCFQDLCATKELFNYWDKYINVK